MSIFTCAPYCSSNTPYTAHRLCSVPAGGLRCQYVADGASMVCTYINFSGFVEHQRLLCYLQISLRLALSSFRLSFLPPRRISSQLLILLHVGFCSLACLTLSMPVVLCQSKKNTVRACIDFSGFAECQLLLFSPSALCLTLSILYCLPSPAHHKDISSYISCLSTVRSA